MIYYVQPPYYFYVPVIPQYKIPTKRGIVLPMFDHGPRPVVFDIEDTTKQNNNFRTALWTGGKMQLTLMSLLPGESIGLERHPSTDQFIRIEQGKGTVEIGDTAQNLSMRLEVEDDDAIIIPAGKWHNLTNTGNIPLKLYSIYAPAEHPHGTIQQKKK